MPKEKSVGAVIFRREKEKIHYLLLHYPPSAKSTKDYWDFPKGHMENEEQEIETAKREIKEETGLKDIEFVKGFKEGIKYFFRFEGKNISKTVAYFLTEAKNGEVRISQEHIGFEWLSYPEALERLTFKNSREILEKANNFLC